MKYYLPESFLSFFMFRRLCFLLGSRNISMSRMLEINLNSDKNDF